MPTISILSRIIDTAHHRPLDERDIQRFLSHVDTLGDDKKRVLTNTLMNAAANCPIKGAFQKLLNAGLRITTYNDVPVMCTTLVDVHQAQAEDIAALLCHHPHDGSEISAFAITLDQLPGLKEAVFAKDCQMVTNILIDTYVTTQINSEAS